MRVTRVRTSRFVATVCAGALLIAACGSDDDSAGSTSPPATAAGTSAPAAGTSAPAATTGAPAKTSAPAPSGKPWVIPFLDDVTGTLAVSFLPAYAGFQTYVDWVNDNGGVHGRPVEVELYDAQSNPDVALTESQRILGEEPLLFAHMGSSAASARVAPTVVAEGITFVGGSVGQDMLVPPQKNIFGVGMTAGMQGPRRSPPKRGTS